MKLLRRSLPGKRGEKIREAGNLQGTIDENIREAEKYLQDAVDISKIVDSYIKEFTQSLSPTPISTHATAEEEPTSPISVYRNRFERFKQSFDDSKQETDPEKRLEYSIRLKNEVREILESIQNIKANLPELLMNEYARQRFSTLRAAIPIQNPRDMGLGDLVNEILINYKTIGNCSPSTILGGSALNILSECRTAYSERNSALFNELNRRDRLYSSH